MWILECEDGLELCDGQGNCVRSVKRSGNILPIGELLKGQAVPGNMVRDLSKKVRVPAAPKPPAPGPAPGPNPLPPAGAKYAKPPVKNTPAIFKGSRNGAAIEGIVMHYTAGATASSAYNWFADPKNPYKTSAHYVIGRDGQVFQCVADSEKAHHAGIHNSRTIGIEHVAVQGQGLTPAQSAASAALCRYLVQQYPIRYINGHRFLQGQQTDCPHSLFGARTEAAVQAWVKANVPNLK